LLVDLDRRVLKIFTMTEDHLKNLVKAVLEAEKSKGLIPWAQQEPRLMELCGKYLMSKGYRVVKASYKLSAQPKDVKELVEYYCKVLNDYYPGRFLNQFDKKEATKIMSALVESRMPTAFNRKAALAEAATIVYTVFDKEKYLGLRAPPDIRSFNVNSTRRWIVDRAIELINDMDYAVREKEDEEACDALADAEWERLKKEGNAPMWSLLGQEN
jgi:hypothetical protein